MKHTFLSLLAIMLVIVICACDTTTEIANPGYGRVMIICSTGKVQGDIVGQEEVSLNPADYGSIFSNSRAAMWTLDSSNRLQSQMRSNSAGNLDDTFAPKGEHRVYALCLYKSEYNSFFNAMDTDNLQVHGGKRFHDVGYYNRFEPTFTSPDPVSAWRGVINQDFNTALDNPAIELGHLTFNPDHDRGDFTVGYNNVNWNGGNRVYVSYKNWPERRAWSELFEHLTNTTNLFGGNPDTPGELRECLFYAYTQANN